MTMGGKVFCDTNIVLRTFHDSLTGYEAISSAVRQLVEDDWELWISRQVLREYLVQITHPKTLHQPFSADEAIAQVELLYNFFSIADETEEVTGQLTQLIHSYSVQGKQIHDANVVATLLTYDLVHLFTLNLADMKRYLPEIIIFTLDGSGNLATITTA